MAPLVCQGCAAPVPLPPDREGVCPYCRTRLLVPDAYLALRADAARTRNARRAAERAWRALPRPLPTWFTGAATVVIILLSVALTVASLIAWAWFDFFSSPRNMLMLGVFSPVFLLIAAIVELGAATSYARELSAMQALPPRREGAHPICRACGAPLHLEPDAIAATCDYCLMDSVVVRPTERSRALLARERISAQGSLEGAIRAAEANRSDRRIARYITVTVLALSWLALWFALPGE